MRGNLVVVVGRWPLLTCQRDGKFCGHTPTHTTTEQHHPLITATTHDHHPQATTMLVDVVGRWGLANL